MDDRLTDETLANLVTQFSSAWDYLRELVQNSMDAGSTAISVWTDFVHDEREAQGVIEIHVDDFGEGMSEAIIDGQLTQLFASAKEGDMTKIGKFGIGFVSVFALQPQGVLVHTGRGGEYWEVFFHEDLSFTKTRIEGPVEGTQITSFLVGGAARYADAVERVRATLKKWCVHSDAEISFEDRAHEGPVETITAPFAVEGEYAVVTTRGEIEVAAAFSRQPIYGFFNHGLALAVSSDGDSILGERAQRFRHLAFKVKSPRLEHTLSRETVMQDENFDEAMAAVAGVVKTELRAELSTSLEHLVAQPNWDIDDLSRYARGLAYLADEPEDALRDEGLAERAILRTADGAPSSLRALWEQAREEGQVYVSREPSPLVAQLRTDGRLVWLDDAGGSLRHLVGRFLGAKLREGLVGRLSERLGRASALRFEIVDPSEVVLAVRPLEAAEIDAESLRLVNAARDALASVGRRFADLRLGEIEGPATDGPLFVFADRARPLMSRSDMGVYRRSFLERPVVVVDPRHPHFSVLTRLWTESPCLAIFALARALVVHEAASPPSDEELDAACGRIAEGFAPGQAEGSGRYARGRA